MPGSKTYLFQIMSFRYDTLKLYHIIGRFIHGPRRTLSGDIQDFSSNVLKIRSLKKDCTVLIHFQSDYSVGGRGFHIWYQSSKYLFSVHVIF